jgi:hypothetical protein
MYLLAKGHSLNGMERLMEGNRRPSTLILKDIIGIRRDDLVGY